MIDHPSLPQYFVCKVISQLKSEKLMIFTFYSFFSKFSTDVVWDSSCWVVDPNLPYSTQVCFLFSFLSFCKHKLLPILTFFNSVFTSFSFSQYSWDNVCLYFCISYFWTIVFLRSVCNSDIQSGFKCDTEDLYVAELQPINSPKYCWVTQTFKILMKLLKSRRREG